MTGLHMIHAHSLNQSLFGDIISLGWAIAFPCIPLGPYEIREKITKGMDNRQTNQRISATITFIKLSQEPIIKKHCVSEFKKITEKCTLLELQN
jgi:hypothetical protein